MPRLALVILVVVSAAAAACAQPRSILDLPGGKAQRAIVTAGAEPVEIGEGEPLMARAVQGVMADLKGKDLNQLRAAVPPNPMLGDASEAAQICTIHLHGGGESKSVAIYQKDDAFIAVEVLEDGSPGSRAQLRRDAFADLYASWPQYRGSFESAEVSQPRGEVFALPQPYVPGRYYMDKDTAGARLFGGSTRMKGTDRLLESSTFHVRLPKGYDPRTPAGLLVWVNAIPSGIIPPTFEQVLDELNIIAIGAANSGNSRSLVTRVQLALDAAATASQRFHIDPRRVYISGISGGGRVATIAQVCFPEVFTGAAPMIGVSCYQNVPNGLGQYYRSNYTRPPAAVFSLTRQRRIAALTGRQDGNLLEINGAAEIFKRDGIPVRVWEDPKLGHELPKAADTREALVWIDEPWQKLREQERQAAAKALEVYTTRIGERGPATSSERGLLMKVLEAGPWTEAAWRGWELLQADE